MQIETLIFTKSEGGKAALLSWKCRDWPSGVWVALTSKPELVRVRGRVAQENGLARCQAGAHFQMPWAHHPIGSSPSRNPSLILEKQKALSTRPITLRSNLWYD